MTTKLTNEETIMVLESRIRRVEAELAHEKIQSATWSDAFRRERLAKDAARNDASQMYDALLAVRESLERRSPNNGRDDKILERIYPAIDAHATTDPSVPHTAELETALRWLAEMSGYAAQHIDENWYQRNGIDLRNAIDQANALLATLERERTVQKEVVEQ